MIDATPYTVEIPELSDDQINEMAELLVEMICDGQLAQAGERHPSRARQRLRPGDRGRQKNRSVA